MKVVLDASAAMQVALSRKQSAGFAATLRDADEVLAPDLLVAEVTNTVWKYHQFEQLDLRDCDGILDAALGLVDTLVPSKEVHREAFLLARLARRPVCDMLYVALAQREDAILLTADASLAKEAVRQGVRTG